MPGALGLNEHFLFSGIIPFFCLNQTFALSQAPKMDSLHLAVKYAQDEWYIPSGTEFGIIENKLFQEPLLYKFKTLNQTEHIWKLER